MGVLSVIFTHVYSSTLAVSRAALTSSVMPELWISAGSSLMLLHAEVMSLYVKILHITDSSIWTSTRFLEFCNKAKPYMKKDFVHFVHFTFNALSEIVFFYHMGSTYVYYCEIAFIWHLAHLNTSAGSHGCLTLTKKPELHVSLPSWSRFLLWWATALCWTLPCSHGTSSSASSVCLLMSGRRLSSLQEGWLLDLGPPWAYRVHNIVHFLSWVAWRLLCQLHQGKDSFPSSKFFFRLELGRGVHVDGKWRHCYEL